MAITDIALTSNIALNDAATNDDTSTVGEPSVAVAGSQIYVTGNWYASRSTNGGSTWSHVDPFTTLPSAAGGFCCDQVVLHDSGRGVWIWILQYIQKNGTNVYRLAATRDNNFSTGGWYWWDIAPATLNASWTNVWFDYPDAALTRTNLVVTFNVFDAANNWVRAAIMRFPLDTIANAGTLGFTSWSTTNNGSLRLTQGAQQTMYWGSQISTQQLRLFSWIDGQTNINWWDINVTQWNDTALSSIAPNGVNWLGRVDPRITGAWLANGIIGFMWTAGADAKHPHPYCKVVRIRESTKQVIDQPDLWSQSRAWAYPAASPNGAGDVGFTAFHGGGGRHPGHVVGARDDASSTWRTRYSRLGTNSPSAPAWGDYLTCRAQPVSPRTWVAAAYTLEGGETRRDIIPRVVQFVPTP